MAYLLWNLLADSFAALGRSEVSIATGGTTTTLVDSTFAGQGKDNDYLDGTVIILRDVAGTGAAPEGEFKRISSSTDSSGTLTFDAMSAAPAAGDTYMRVDSYFTLQNMIKHANAGLRSLGELANVDTVTLDTVTEQTEYTMAVAWKRREPIRIDIQGKTTAANDNKWYPLDDWAYVPASPGSTGLIEFKHQPTANRDLRIWYYEDHPQLTGYNGAVAEVIHPSLAVAATVYEALRWQNARLAGSDKSLIQQLNDAKVEMDRMRQLHRIWRPHPRTNRLRIEL